MAAKDVTIRQAVKNRYDIDLSSYVFPQTAISEVAYLSVDTKLLDAAGEPVVLVMVLAYDEQRKLRRKGYNVEIAVRTQLIHTMTDRTDVTELDNLLLLLEQLKTSTRSDTLNSDYNFLRIEQQEDDVEPVAYDMEQLKTNGIFNTSFLTFYQTMI